MWVPARTHIRIVATATASATLFTCLLNLSYARELRAIRDRKHALEVSEAIIQQHEEGGSRIKQSDFTLLRQKEIEMRHRYAELQTTAEELSQALSRKKQEAPQSSSNVASIQVTTDRG